jgi:hypothetical protein
MIILLFAVAAVLGLSLLIPVLQGKTPSRPFVFAHGGIAAVALVLLIVQFLKPEKTVPAASVALFVVAAIGGFVLFTRDMQGQPLPKGLALLHAGLAVVAFLMLVFAAL